MQEDKRGQSSILGVTAGDLNTSASPLNLSVNGVLTGREQQRQAVPAGTGATSAYPLPAYSTETEEEQQTAFEQPPFGDVAATGTDVEVVDDEDESKGRRSTFGLAQQAEILRNYDENPSPGNAMLYNWVWLEQLMNRPLTAEEVREGVTSGIFGADTHEKLAKKHAKDMGDVTKRLLFIESYRKGDVLKKDWDAFVSQLRGEMVQAGVPPEKASDIYGLTADEQAAMAPALALTLGEKKTMAFLAQADLSMEQKALVLQLKSLPRADIGNSQSGKAIGTDNLFDRLIRRYEDLSPEEFDEAIEYAMMLVPESERSYLASVRDTYLDRTRDAFFKILNWYDARENESPLKAADWIEEHLLGDAVSVDPVRDAGADFTLNANKSKLALITEANERGAGISIGRLRDKNYKLSDKAKKVLGEVLSDIREKVKKRADVLRKKAMLYEHFTAKYPSFGKVQDLVRDVAPDLFNGVALMGAAVVSPAAALPVAAALYGPQSYGERANSILAQGGTAGAAMEAASWSAGVETLGDTLASLAIVKGVTPLLGALASKTPLARKVALSAFYRNPRVLEALARNKSALGKLKLKAPGALMELGADIALETGTEVAQDWAHGIIDAYYAPDAEVDIAGAAKEALSGIGQIAAVTIPLSVLGARVSSVRGRRHLVKSVSEATGFDEDYVSKHLGDFMSDYIAENGMAAASRYVGVENWKDSGATFYDVQSLAHMVLGGEYSSALSKSEKRAILEEALAKLRENGKVKGKVQITDKLIETFDLVDEAAKESNERRERAHKAAHGRVQEVVARAEAAEAAEAAKAADEAKKARSEGSENTDGNDTETRHSTAPATEQQDSPETQKKTVEAQRRASFKSSVKAFYEYLDERAENGLKIAKGADIRVEVEFVFYGKQPEAGRELNQDVVRELQAVKERAGNNYEVVMFLDQYYSLADESLSRPTTKEQAAGRVRTVGLAYVGATSLSNWGQFVRNRWLDTETDADARALKDYSSKQLALLAAIVKKVLPGFTVSFSVNPPSWVKGANEEINGYFNATEKKFWVSGNATLRTVVHEIFHGVVRHLREQAKAGDKKAQAELEKLLEYARQTPEAIKQVVYRDIERSRTGSNLPAPPRPGAKADAWEILDEVGARLYEREQTAEYETLLRKHGKWWNGFKNAFHGAMKRLVGTNDDEDPRDIVSSMTARVLGGESMAVADSGAGASGSPGARYSTRSVLSDSEFQAVNAVLVRQDFFSDEEYDEYVRFSIGKARKQVYRNRLRKLNIMTDEQIESTITEIEKLGEASRNGGDSKLEEAALYWVLKGSVSLPEDNYKVVEAVKYAERFGARIEDTGSPQEIIDAYAEKVRQREKKANPRDFKTLTYQKSLPGGYEIFTVEDSREGQQDMRTILNSHLGPDTSPWCLLQAKGNGSGELSVNAERYWRYYSAFRKRAAFKDGRVFAFFASASRSEPIWWDLKDRPSEGLKYSKPISAKDFDGKTEGVFVDVVLFEGEDSKIGGYHKDEDGEPGEYWEWDAHKKLREHIITVREGDRVYLTLSETYTDGVLTRREEVRPDGIVYTQEWNPDGSLKSEQEVDPSARREITRTYYDNGNLELVMEVRKGGGSGRSNTYITRNYDPNGVCVRYLFDSPKGEYEAAYSSKTGQLLYRHVKKPRNGRFREHFYYFEPDTVPSGRSRLREVAKQEPVFNEYGEFCKRLYVRKYSSKGILESSSVKGAIYESGNSSRSQASITCHYIDGKLSRRNYDVGTWNEYTEIYDEKGRVEIASMYESLGTTSVTYHYDSNGELASTFAHGRLAEKYGPHTAIGTVRQLKKEINDSLASEFRDWRGSTVGRDSRRNTGDIDIPVRTRTHFNSDEEYGDYLRYSIGKARKQLYRNRLRKLNNATDEQIEKTIAEIEKLGEASRNGGDSKLEEAALHWVLRGTVLLPNDNEKIIDAVKLAKRFQQDPMDFESPMDVLNSYQEIADERDKLLNPRNFRELHFEKKYDNGIEIYRVDDTRAGQIAMRKILDSHHGRDTGPWCLLYPDSSRPYNLSEEAWSYWKSYNSIPKRAAFMNGKLCAFNASEIGYNEWWDLNDTGVIDEIPFIKGIKKQDFDGKTAGVVAQYTYNEQTKETRIDRFFKGSQRRGEYWEWDREKKPSLHEKREKREYAEGEREYGDGYVITRYQSFLDGKLSMDKTCSPDLNSQERVTYKPDLGIITKDTAHYDPQTRLQSLTSADYDIQTNALLAYRTATFNRYWSSGEYHAELPSDRTRYDEVRLYDGNVNNPFMWSIMRVIKTKSGKRAEYIFQRDKKTHRLSGRQVSTERYKRTHLYRDGRLINVHIEKKDAYRNVIDDERSYDELNGKIEKRVLSGSIFTKNPDSLLSDNVGRFVEHYENGRPTRREWIFAVNGRRFVIEAEYHPHKGAWRLAASHYSMFRRCAPLMRGWKDSTGNITVDFVDKNVPPGVLSFDVTKLLNRSALKLLSGTTKRAREGVDDVDTDSRSSTRGHDASDSSMDWDMQLNTWAIQWAKRALVHGNWDKDGVVPAEVGKLNSTWRFRVLNKAKAIARVALNGKDVSPSRAVQDEREAMKMAADAYKMIMLETVVQTAYDEVVHGADTERKAKLRTKDIVEESGRRKDRDKRVEKAVNTAEEAFDEIMGRKGEELSSEASRQARIALREAVDNAAQNVSLALSARGKTWKDELEWLKPRVSRATYERLQAIDRLGIFDDIEATLNRANTDKGFEKQYLAVMTVLIEVFDNQEFLKDLSGKSEEKHLAALREKLTEAFKAQNNARNDLEAARDNSVSSDEKISRLLVRIMKDLAYHLINRDTQRGSRVKVHEWGGKNATYVEFEAEVMHYPRVLQALAEDVKRAVAQIVSNRQAKGNLGAMTKAMNDLQNAVTLRDVYFAAKWVLSLTAGEFSSYYRPMAEQRLTSLIMSLPKKVDERTDSDTATYSPQWVLFAPIVRETYMKFAESDFETVADEIETLERRLGEDGGVHDEELRARIRALQLVGGADYFSTERLNYTFHFIRFERDAAYLSKREEEVGRVRQVREAVKPFLAALEANADQTVDKGAVAHFVDRAGNAIAGLFSLKQRLIGMIKHAKGDVYAAALRFIDEWAGMIERAALKHEQLVEENRVWWHDTMVALWGSEAKAAQAIARANVKLAELRKFNHRTDVGDGTLDMSPLQALHVYLSSIQQSFDAALDAPEAFSSSDATARLIKQRMDYLAQRDELHAWLENYEGGVLLKLADKVKERWAQLRPQINEAYRTVFGFDMYDPWRETNYYPLRFLAVKGHGVANPSSQDVLLPVARRFQSRTVNVNELNTQVDFLRVVTEQMQAELHTIAYVEAHKFSERVLKLSEFMRVFNARVNQGARDGFNRHLGDVFALPAQLEKASSESAVIAPFVKASAVVALAGSPFATIRQALTGGSYLNFVSAKDWMAAATFPITSPVKWWQAFRKVWGDSRVKSRYTVPAQYVQDAILRGEGNPRRIFRKIVNAMMFNIQLGDAVPLMTVGVGLYVNAYERNLNAGLSEQEAHDKAIEEMMSLSERTQQTRRMMNRNALQRSNNAAVRAFGQFKTAQDQMSGNEARAWSDWLSNPSDPEKRNRLVRSVIAHHLLVAGLTDLIIQLIFIALADDDDDRDFNLPELMAAMFLGGFWGSTGVALIGQAMSWGDGGNKAFGRATVLDTVPSAAVLTDTVRKLIRAGTITKRELLKDVYPDIPEDSEFWQTDVSEADIEKIFWAWAKVTGAGRAANRILGPKSRLGNALFEDEEAREEELVR